jgi:hypothetical protein
MSAWYNIHYKEMATISITDIADNCFVPHDSLKTIESIFTRCLFCESTRDYDNEIYQGLCYSNSGMTVLRMETFTLRRFDLLIKQYQ